MRAKGKSKQPRYYCSYTKYRQRQQMAQHLSSFNRKFIELEVWNRYSLLQNDTELITEFTDPKSKQKTNMKWQHKKLLGIFRLVIWVWVPYDGNNTGRLILLMTFFQEWKKIISHLFVIRISGINRKSLWALMEMWFPVETIYDRNWGMIPRILFY